MLNDTLAICRDVYNSLVNWRKHDYEVFGASPNYHKQAIAITAWKQEHEELTNVYSQVLQNVAVRVDLAFQAFFRRVKAGETPGYPRPKGYGQYDSITYPQSGYKTGESAVFLSLFGKRQQIKAKIHRSAHGAIKTCTVRKLAGKWYACFVVERETELLPACDEQIGVDVGIEKFASLSNGEFIANPKFFRKDEAALAKASRKQSRTKKGSPERRKANKVLYRIHERVRNRRHDFVHQQSRKLVNRFGSIFAEKLNVKGMVKNHCLAKSISDAAWSMFRYCLSYKAENAGRKYIEVNPAWTSQECSGCHNIVKKPLKERWHYCPHCGLSLDRDTNAAINIFALGQQSMVGIPA